LATTITKNAAAVSASAMTISRDLRIIGGMWHPLFVDLTPANENAAAIAACSHAEVEAFYARNLI
jgi:hypothetical protein